MKENLKQVITKKIVEEHEYENPKTHKVAYYL